MTLSRLPSAAIHPPAPRVRRLTPDLLALGILCALSSPSFAQSANEDATNLDAVTVSGIRGSLQSSMNLKRDSTGVVDGIIAEDIGKFPDTNLAESLQRISGVSIDRTASGEGSSVTVRGVGPAFNLVLLNGRQIPNSNYSSRAFDFANLASEAVSELQVFKTVHADVPTGGIGATINIRTARPLENPGFRASVGVKGVMDESVDNLPRSFPGKSVTPEVSGIYSNTFADDRFGVAASFSYQERDSGYADANVGAGWRAFRGDDRQTRTRIRVQGDEGDDKYRITNPPGPTDIYARPQNFNMGIAAVQRQRRNGQVALQFAPTDTITTTLDFTYAENRVQSQRADLSVWFNLSGGAMTFTDGPIAAPTIYSQDIPNNNSDIGMGINHQNSRTELKSLGFNVEWQVHDNLDLTLDYHDSRADLRPDNPFGSSRLVAASAFLRGDTTVDFSGKLPILTIKLPDSVDQVGPEHMVGTGSGFVSLFNHSEIQQGQIKGTFRFADYQALDFGVAYTDVYNRSVTADMSVNTWSGVEHPDGTVATPADYPDDIWYADNMGRYLDKFAGHHDPRLTDRFMIPDFERLRQRNIEITGRPDWYEAPKDVFAYDRRLTEESRSAWLQWRNTFDWGVPVNVAAGVRYETTDVISPALVLPPRSNVFWSSTNELTTENADAMVETRSKGKYHYWLPNLDIRANLLDNLIVRGSYGKSIGRATWSELHGGLAVSRSSEVTGGFGSQGNPGLLPLESKNFDLSLEWYYDEGSYMSVGYFRKNIRNFASSSIISQQPYDVRTPVGGQFWNEAISSGGCQETEMNCIRSYIFSNHADDPSVNYIGVSSTGQLLGTIMARDSDPILTYHITIPTNQRADHLDGFEVNIQHMFGDSGFGMAANYTKVDSGLTYDDTLIGVQSPMVGLSDSANLVAFYENKHWKIRAAYNWRDKFLSNFSGLGYINGAVDGSNPTYTESYGQLDMNVTWEQNEHLAFFVEGINLTNETMRLHSRHRNMLVSASQTGPRYMFGLRYKF